MDKRKIVSIFDSAKAMKPSVKTHTMLFKKYRNEKYTVAFIAIDSKCGLPVQATATAHKKGKTMIIGPAWASIKTQNGIALNGVYNIISEAVNGKYTIINAEKKEA